MTTKLIVRKRCPVCHEGEMKSHGTGYYIDNTFRWEHYCKNCNFETTCADVSYPYEKIKYDAVAEIWED